MFYKIIVLIITLIVILSGDKQQFCNASNDNGDRNNDLELLNSTATELIRLRKFVAEDDYFLTSQGFVINMIKVTNPLIKDYRRKQVVLFVHGLTLSAKSFLMNTAGAEPKDYSDLDASELDKEYLEDLLKDDDTAKSMVFLLSIFGHEVWLINRRSVEVSMMETINLRLELDRNKIDFHDLNEMDLKRFILKRKKSSQKKQLIPGVIKKVANFSYDRSPKFWNYSFDEQAKFDFPEAVDFVLRKTKRKQLTLIGHSAGGQLPLQALALNPKLIKKFFKILLWAPSLHLGGKNPPKLLPATQVTSILKYIGPFPDIEIYRKLRMIGAAFCFNPLAKKLICSNMLDMLFGKAQDSELMKPGYAGIEELSSSREFGQLAESYQKGRTHFFDFGDPLMNKEAYGQFEPPAYNISVIRAKPGQIALWYSKNDRLVPPQAIELVLEDLKCPITVFYNGDTGVTYNHLSFLDNPNVAQDLYITSLQFIEAKL